MTAPAEKSTAGNLSSFSGLFRISALNEKEKNALSGILKDFDSIPQILISSGWQEQLFEEFESLRTQSFKINRWKTSSV